MYRRHGLSSASYLFGSNFGNTAQRNSVLIGQPVPCVKRSLNICLTFFTLRGKHRQTHLLTMKELNERIQYNS